MILSIPTNCEFALASKPSLRQSPRRKADMWSALGLYDYCLTFNQEIRQVWQRKTNWISLLFFVNRYTIVATAIVILVKDLKFVSPVSKVSKVYDYTLILHRSLSSCTAHSSASISVDMCFVCLC